MFDDCHLKEHYFEDHLCAAVVKSLCLHSTSDHVCEDMVWTICCG